MRPTNRRQILGATMAAAAMVIGGCSGTDSTHSTGADTEVVPVSDTDPEVVMGGADTAAAATSTSAGTDIENQSSHFDTEDLAYDESDVVGVSLDGTSAAADSNDVAIDGTTVVIGAGGTYSLSGTLADGEVIVDAGDDDVTVILDGVDITNADGAALAIMNADDAIVLLADGSTNSLTDGATYSFPAAGIDEPNAALYSSADLTIAGDGELIVVAEYNDGITSKDGLVFYAGDISVMAADDGIRGKDYVIIEGGTITVE
ncbi:MAG: carbohydrate-binding domain-containing protein, partial [Actinomycetota bacterium]